MQSFDDYIAAQAKDAWEASMTNAREMRRTYCFFKRSEDAEYAKWVFLASDQDVIPAGYELAWPESVQGTAQQVANLFRSRVGRMPLLPKLQSA